MTNDFWTAKLDAMSVEMEKEYKKFQRTRDMYYALANLVNNDVLTDEETLDCALSWFNHSDLPPYEILKKLGLSK